MKNQSMSLITTVVMACLVTACGGDSSGNSSSQIVCNNAAATPLDEGSIGDFSSAIDNPTEWVLGAGANVLTASTSNADRDYVTFTVGTCDSLDSITLTDFTSTGDDFVAFMGIQEGPMFTVTPETAPDRIDEIDGYILYGSATLNQDLLTPAGQATGAAGFTPPLPAGTYSVWFNQTGVAGEFTMVFEVSRVQP